MRVALAIAGTFFLGVGIIGAFLPVLPTTPFVLLAAGCYARSSKRLHERLLANPVFGSAIRDWDEHCAISRKARTLATIMIVVSIAASILLVVQHPAGRAAMILIAATVIIFIYRLPLRD